ncbi:hypothetical protein [Kitasatospora sp. LaBMicrA B282]|uniref:hypothetical protein n=1 Tax=Kitasatospora sp. LaBMicrA B282 TaxID=3420949 RepID=UPI003D106697
MLGELAATAAGALLAAPATAAPPTVPPHFWNVGGKGATYQDAVAVADVTISHYACDPGPVISSGQYADGTWWVVVRAACEGTE